MIPYPCCEASAPIDSHLDGDTFTCSACLSHWVWIEAEASFLPDARPLLIDGGRLSGNERENPVEVVAPADRHTSTIGGVLEVAEQVGFERALQDRRPLNNDGGDDAR